MKELSDIEVLAKLAKKKDLGIYYTLFKRYQHLVYGQCKRYFSDPADCSDMVMHVLEVSFRRIKPKEVKNFSALIHAITKNECISELRKKKNYKKHIDRFGKIQFEDSPFVENEGMVRLISGLTDEQQQLLLDASIKKLKFEQRQCVRLFFLKRKSYREISEELGLEEKKVKSHLQNGKRNLKIHAQTLLKQLSSSIIVTNDTLKKLIDENVS